MRVLSPWCINAQSKTRNSVTICDLHFERCVGSPSKPTGTDAENARFRRNTHSACRDQSRSLGACRLPGDALANGDILGDCLDPVWMFFRSLGALLGCSRVHENCYRVEAEGQSGNGTSQARRHPRCSFPSSRGNMASCSGFPFSRSSKLSVRLFPVDLWKRLLDGREEIILL